MRNDLTSGNLLKTMLRFSVPYLIACFLQTFYGMADLFITGQFYGAAEVSAVAIGSQLMHMLTVVIVGLAMGATVMIGRSVGEKDSEKASGYIGNTVFVFAIFAAILTLVLLLAKNGIVTILSTPKEAVTAARAYLLICFLGVPFITAYNVLCSIFRGMGDSKRPMYFVAFAGLINIGLDYLMIGGLHMGAGGAAAATVISQGMSVLMALVSLRKIDLGLTLRGRHFKPQKEKIRNLLTVGGPIALQDGLIQISFLVITAIANSRGVDVSAAVGIVEKIISFLFLVPSAMLSTVSAVAAQNAGAGQHARSRKALRYGITACLIFGGVVFLLCQVAATGILTLFARSEPEVIKLGAQYLRTYSLDCAVAGVHFSFSGFFSAYGKSGYSFLHNMLSVLLVRIPGAYLAAVYFPATLYPMGLAAPLGSLLSAVICIFLYRRLLKKEPVFLREKA